MDDEFKNELHVFRTKYTKLAQEVLPAAYQLMNMVDTLKKHNKPPRRILDVLTNAARAHETAHANERLKIHGHDEGDVVFPRKATLLLLSMMDAVYSNELCNLGKQLVNEVWATRTQCGPDIPAKPRTELAARFFAQLFTEVDRLE